MTRPRLIIAPSLPADILPRLSERFIAEGGEGNLTVAEAVTLVRERDAPALLVSFPHKMNAAVIDRLPDCLKILATVTVGYDHIDCEAARRRGLVVTNTPDVLTDCTADLTLMLILAASRRAAEGEQMMRQGWRKRFGMGEFLGHSLRGKCLGIFGMGRIGQAVAARARAFGMTILYCNRRRLPAELELGASFFPDLASMLPHCDIISLHAPAGAETDRVINGASLALLPPGAILVNTARGRLVDEGALIDALRSGQLFAAGLDVFDNEPDFDRRFIELPNVFLTPHIGSATVETRNAMAMRALDNIAAFCAGDPPLDRVA